MASVVSSDKKPALEDEAELGGPTFRPPLYKQRYKRVAEILEQENISNVVDMGCAECKSLRYFKSVKSLRKIVGVDLDKSTLESSMYGLRPHTCDYILSREQPLCIELYSGDLTQIDSRIIGADAVTLIEVIEHLHPPTLAKVCPSVFEGLRPRLVVITTPNCEFNVLFPNFTGMRHWDHKFEWSRNEFKTWCVSVASTAGYEVEFDGVGDPPEQSAHVGHCSQVAIFRRLPSTEGLAPEQTQQSQVYDEVCSWEYPFKPRRPREQFLVEEAEYYMRRTAVQYTSENDVFYPTPSQCSCDSSECADSCQCSSTERQSPWILHEKNISDDNILHAQFLVSLCHIQGSYKIKEQCADAEILGCLLEAHGYELVCRNGQKYVRYSLEVEDESDEEEDGCSDREGEAPAVENSQAEDWECEMWEDCANFVPFKPDIPTDVLSETCDEQFEDCGDDDSQPTSASPVPRPLRGHEQDGLEDPNRFLPEDFMLKYKSHKLIKPEPSFFWEEPGQFSDCEQSD